VATKLTLRLDEALIQKAKIFAKQRGKSVSQLVAEYFTLLDAPLETFEEPLPPIVESLKGILAGSGLDEADYYQHLEEKYL